MIRTLLVLVGVFTSRHCIDRYVRNHTKGDVSVILNRDRIKTMSDTRFVVVNGIGGVVLGDSLCYA